MVTEIVQNGENRVYFSNGDGVHEGFGIYKGRWLVDSKERRDKAEEYSKHNSGPYFTSWFLEATNKKDAVEEYQTKTGNLVRGMPCA